MVGGPKKSKSGRSPYKQVIGRLDYLVKKSFSTPLSIPSLPMNSNKRSHSTMSASLIPSSTSSSSSSSSSPSELVLTGARVMSSRHESEDVRSVIVPIAERDVTANIHIHNTARSTNIVFNYMRNSYQFDITKWSGKGFRTLMKLFFSHTQRDPVHFGEVQYDGEGFIISDPLTPTQRRNIIFQASVDILICLSKIVSTHQRQVLDYAVWYREQKRSDQTYRSYITVLTCHSIVHNQFMSGSVQYEIVEF
jgi:hypothetical protein